MVGPTYMSLALGTVSGRPKIFVGGPKQIVGFGSKPGILIRVLGADPEVDTESLKVYIWVCPWGLFIPNEICRVRRIY